MTSEEVNAIAKDLKVKPETVREMEMRLATATSDVAFDGHGDEDEHSFAPVGFLEDLRYDPARQLENADWSEQSSERIYRALEALDGRSRDIIRARWLDKDKATLHVLAEKYAISAERVRQIEEKAMEKLRLVLGPL